MIGITWRRRWKCKILAAVLVLATLLVQNDAQKAGKKCPKQELILPCRCLSRGEEIQVWCSHSDLPLTLNALHSLGEHLHHPIDELILENNHLPSMPGRAFLPLKVMRLMLRYNGLERLSSDWLTGLETSLMELFIVEPELRTLPEESLASLKRLEAVTIQTNLMKRLPDFSGLASLRYLLLQSTNLVELSPRHFRDLPRLERLHVAGSLRLERLEAGFLQDLPRLKLVNISDCGLSWMHLRSITRLPSLQTLSLTGNKITDAGMIGRSARELPALETIHLDFNSIDRLNEAAFVDLPSLKTITLANNRIVELHHGAFHRVPSLRTVDLNHNLVRRVHPESFLQNSGSGLEELWLVHNDISHIAELRALLDALPRLKFLDMSHNNMETIPFGALRGHAMLERLHLDYNKIHQIDREAFMAMPALRELRLKNNSISDVLEMPFWNLPALKGLDLSGNFFRRIEPGLLANLPTLKKVDLSTNEIMFLSPDAFLSTPELELVNVSQNGLATIHPATFRHLRNLYELDISDNRLIEFVPGLPRGIEKLHIQKNVIPIIPQQPSPDLDLPSLRMLDISANVIQGIPSNAFRSFPQLRRLYMGSNAMHRLDEKSLSGLERLEVLNVEDNRLVQVHPNAFKGLPEIWELNLRENRLDLLTPETINDLPNLTNLDLSRNQLTEIVSNTFDGAKEIKFVDLSHNGLVALPSSLFNLKELKSLDFTDNRLKVIPSDALTSLISLEKLTLSRNYLQHIPFGTFANLPKLKTLKLDNNEITGIEPKAISMLPSLKSINLSRNKLVEIPPVTFYDLPTLQDISLQENYIQLIGANAFAKMPHLLMLNLSSNHIDNLENAGLRSLRSLEMLDLSNNRLIALRSEAFERMEWLVELRLDNNGICTVQGSTFNSMPRLRVLSLRNNRLTSFPEYAVQKLRGNIAVLDIDGNPLTCDCNLFWLRAWLQESSLMGPRCGDGALLRETRLSREECVNPDADQNAVQDPQQVQLAPGCEAELFNAPAPYATSQVFASIRDNRTKYALGGKNHLNPSPEESDYFYDDYIDYPYNDTTRNNLHQIGATKNSSHYTVGNTPVIYAATNKNKTVSKKPPPKEIIGSPSSSGFTFFGVPLPSLSLNGINNFLGNGRMETTTPRKQTSSTVTRPTIPTIQTAERKAAIVNSPPRSNRPYYPERIPPSVTLNQPEIFNGGFIPLLPGSGGFKPFFPETHDTPLVKKMINYNASIEKVNMTNAQATTVAFQSSTTPRIPQTSTAVVFNTPPTTIKSISTTQSFKEVLREPTIATVEVTTASKPLDQEEYLDDDEYNNEDTTARIEELKQIQNLSELLGFSSTNKVQNTIKKNSVDLTTPGTKFEDIFKEVVENVSIPTGIQSNEDNINPLGDLLSSFSTNNDRKTNANSKDETQKTPLSTLLVPGGQQPQYRPSGRPTITKVHSPETLDMLGTDIVAQPHNRAGKNTILDKVTERANARDENEENWYFANYNKTNLEPYIGPGAVQSNGGYCRTKLDNLGTLIVCFVIIKMIYGRV